MVNELLLALVDALVEAGFAAKYFEPLMEEVVGLNSSLVRQLPHSIRIEYTDLIWPIYLVLDSCSLTLRCPRPEVDFDLNQAGSIEAIFAFLGSAEVKAQLREAEEFTFDTHAEWPHIRGPISHS